MQTDLQSQSRGLRLRKGPTKAHHDFVVANLLGGFAEAFGDASLLVSLRLFLMPGDWRSRPIGSLFGLAGSPIELDGLPPTKGSLRQYPLQSD